MSVSRGAHAFYLCTNQLAFLHTSIQGLFIILNFLFLCEGAKLILASQFIHLPINQIVVTKADVINEISDKTGIDKADVQASVEAFFTVVKNNMANGENVYVRGFGSFVNKKRARKIARNISKNTAIVIDEHYIPSFKPSKIFVEKIKKSNKIR